MSAGLMSVPGMRRAMEQDGELAEVRRMRSKGPWNAQRFACEQIRGLVRRVFFAPANQNVRQVVFTTVDPGTEIGGICRHVGEALAINSGSDVGLVSCIADLESNGHGIVHEPGDLTTPLRQIATRVHSHMWQLRIPAQSDVTNTVWQRYLFEVRNQFPYSVIEAPGVGEFSEPIAMGQVADGLILVLSAQRTRRASALKIKEHLDAAQVRILGAVLSDREFPIPEQIYRRL